ncbi:MAG: hypothetical protein OXC83_07525 [Chloroflexi bacterium]|nr:hypothetical protein [Chloroflexota bacterium]
MPIIDYADGNTQEYRAAMLNDIRRQKAADPDFTVVDIGGRHNPWADDVVDIYVDFFEFETDKRLYVGDVNGEDIWRQLEADGPFDFVIISHVLEDVRDPITGLNWLPRVAKAGFLGLPVKHREVANSKSGYWLGQSHHYWIFGVKNDDSGDPILMVVPKWHCVNYFNTNTPYTEPLGEEDSNLGPRTLSWFDPDKAGYDRELGVIWQKTLPFWVPDYTLMVPEQIELLRTVFKDGV